MTDDEDNQRAAADRWNAIGPAHLLVNAVRRLRGVVSGEDQGSGAGGVLSTLARLLAMRYASAASTLDAAPVLLRPQMTLDLHGPTTLACATTQSAASDHHPPIPARIDALPGKVTRVFRLHARAFSLDYLSAFDSAVLPRGYVLHSAGGLHAFLFPVRSLPASERVCLPSLTGRHRQARGCVVLGRRVDGGAPC